MNRLLAAAKSLLLAWAIASLTVALTAAGLMVIKTCAGNRPQVDEASVQDVRFVLNWAKLGATGTEKVIHSYVSARGLTGDHIDAYAIQTSSPVAIEYLTVRKDEFEPRWYRGDQLPPVVDDAVGFVGGWLHLDEVAWFPREAELRSSKIYVWPVTVDYRGVTPESAQVIFVRPRDGMVFYFDVSM